MIVLSHNLIHISPCSVSLPFRPPLSTEPYQVPPPADFDARYEPTAQAVGRHTVGSRPYTTV